MEYPKRVYKKAEPIPYKPIDGTEATWVDTYEGVLEMLEHLKKAKEIAVDLEHHDFRTYTGLVSLMQVSTRDQDWIVDTLKPWRHKLEVLNEVFADPNIVKVLYPRYHVQASVLMTLRSSTVRIWTWCGYNEISVSMSTGYSIHISHASSSPIPGAVLPISSPTLPALPQTSSIS